MSDRCTSYCGVACVNGYCPVADCGFFDAASYCEVCPYYAGCDDCAFVGTDYCPNFNKDGGDVP